MTSLGYYLVLNLTDPGLSSRTEIHKPRSRHRNSTLTGAGRFGNAANMTEGRRSKTARMADEVERKRKDRETGTFEPVGWTALLRDE